MAWPWSSPASATSNIEPDKGGALRTFHWGAWLAAYGIGATIGVVLPYSRLNENEADEIGLLYSAKAGYDPRAGITFWQRMLEESKGKTELPSFLSTHPTDENRIQHIQSLIAKVMPAYKRSRNNY